MAAVFAVVTAILSVGGMDQRARARRPPHRRRGAADPLLAHPLGERPRRRRRARPLPPRRRDLAHHAVPRACGPDRRSGRGRRRRGDRGRPSGRGRMLRTRQLDDVRQLERERLARDLHDTVAHHLTAIAISAQAGLARRRQQARRGHRRAAARSTRRPPARWPRPARCCGCCAPRTRPATARSTTWPASLHPPVPGPAVEVGHRRRARCSPPPWPPPSSASPRRRWPTPAATHRKPRSCGCRSSRGSTWSS